MIPDQTLAEIESAARAVLEATLADDVTSALDPIHRILSLFPLLRAALAPAEENRCFECDGELTIACLRCAALAPVTDEEVGRIRERHEALERLGELAHHDWASEAHTDRATLLLALTEAQERAETQAARDVLAERERQKSVEGWTPEHDDEHEHGDMALAAACYAAQGDPEPQRAYSLDVDEAGNPTPPEPPQSWPWSADWWKPKDHRRNLVRAGALILAEIERLDRLSARKEPAP